MEQSKLINDLEQLEQEYKECKENEKDISEFIQKIKQCLSVDTLTRAMIVELVDYIEVSNVYEVDGEPNIDVNITYKFSRSPAAGKNINQGIA